MMGLTRLNVEASIKNEQGKDSKQSKLANEILDLYYWWQARPQREDPYGDLDEIADMTDAWFAKAEKAEEKFIKEDQKMLLRLIKIRTELWS